MQTPLRLSLLIFALLLLPALSVAQDASSDQSRPLGDVARQIRAAQGKKSAKVITEENLEKGPDFANGAAINPSGAGSASNTAAAADSATAAKADTGDQAKGAKESAAAGTGEPKKEDEQLRARYEEQKKSVELLERELNVLQREFEIQTTMYYADAGTQLRDPAGWAKKRQKYQDDIAEKQKQLDKAKDELEKLKDQGRRSGASPSAFED